VIRVLKGQVATLSVSRSQKPASATVAITRDRDSVVVVASGTACTVEADRVVYSLAAQSSVSNLTATFTITEADASTSTVVVPVQVVGTRTTSIAECRRLKPLDDVNRYPDELIETAITQLELGLEDACGVSFVPVERLNVRHDGSGDRELYARHARPLSISAVSISDGVSTLALDAGQVSGLILDEGAGVILRPTYLWDRGRRNIIVSGVFGFSSVPGIVRQAVTLGVRQMLIDSRVDPRAQSVTNEDGTTAQLVTAGVRGATFSLPELNQVVMQYRTSFGVA